MDAYRAWKDGARNVRTLFLNAGMQVPPLLAKFLGEEPAVDRPGVLQMWRGSLPFGFLPGSWIYVPAAASSVRALVLAILRAAGGGKTARELHEAIEASRSANEGSVANVGTRLTLEGLVTRDSEGVWSLTDPNRAPLLHEGALWGPMAMFTVQEIAAYRREAIQFLLRKPENRRGLQQGQIVDQLHSLKWMIAPTSKDIIKLDISQMLEPPNNQLARVPGTGKVRLRDTQEGES